MSGFYNYDTRGASEASQILNLERMVQERDTEIERLRVRVKELEALLRAGTFDPDGERVCVCHIVDGTCWYCKVEAALGWKEKS